MVNCSDPPLHNLMPTNWVVHIRNVLDGQEAPALEASYVFQRFRCFLPAGLFEDFGLAKAAKNV